MKYCHKSGLKINLSLKVVGKRPDNFHLLESIFVPIVDIYDEIALDIAPSDKLTINFTSNISSVNGFDGNNNLAVKAAELYCRKSGITAKILLYLRKNIPIGGGVGGGSGNAACVLKILNEKYNRYNNEQLKELALQLGSDVPFFIDNKLAQVSGIGEVVKPFESAMDLYFVLIFPCFPVSTVWAFKNLPEELKKVDDLKRNESVFAGLKAGDFDLVYNNLHNDFEEILFKKYPLYQVIAESLNSRKLSISGSGSTAFILCKSENEQNMIYDRLEALLRGENLIFKKAVYRR